MVKEAKSIGEEAAEEEDDVLSWVQKSRKIQKKVEREKKIAKKRAAMLDELDEEGVGEDIVNRSFYLPKELRNVKVTHTARDFEEGSSILTLKDAPILNDGLEEQEDELENIQISEQKRLDEIKKLKEKKKTYDIYEQFDKKQDILPQYDEQKQEKSLTIGSLTKAKQSQAMKARLEAIRSKLKKPEVDISGPSSSVVDDFRSKDEGFKRSKKKKRRIRGKTAHEDEAVFSSTTPGALLVEMLEGKDEKEGEEKKVNHEGSTDHGSRSRVLKTEKSKMYKEEKEKLTAGYAFAKKKAATLSQQQYGESSPSSSSSSSSSSLETVPVPKVPTVPSPFSASAPSGQDVAMEITETYSGQAIDQLVEEEDQLYNSLARSRKPSLKRVDAADIRRRAKMKREEKKEEGTGGSGLVFSETTEFCRLIRNEDSKTPPPSSVRVKREAPSSPIVKKEEESDSGNNLSETKGAGIKTEDDDVEMEENENRERENGETQDESLVVDDQPLVGKGLASALRYMRSTKTEDETVYVGRPSDKSGEDLRPLPGDTIRIEYRDPYGRIITPKEAFREMSHKFHGKPPGKNKQEKRLKRYLEDQRKNQMSATDTPLNSVDALKKAQKKKQSAFVVIDGMGGSSIQPMPSSSTSRGGFDGSKTNPLSSVHVPTTMIPSSVPETPGEEEGASSSSFSSSSFSSSSFVGGGGKIRVEFGLSGPSSSFSSSSFSSSSAPISGGVGGGGKIRVEFGLSGTKRKRNTLAETKFDE
eukprot:CAMPEP_0201504648 /NCGR_PEP_ID=MMETSP0151_2-20130828/85324_1 /ASSEMBLY_ACC=CAM_ASM_000257 /TAXON_ID=200890 /ORGANISM="Paramoeba atlantica, Strain 621/1 / CCAP 1560/9" /LENGTH=754 /DNA_ID=CAMNT_0047898411 /DNA_START=42 /DNA_END=2307 /DNA_ORIENTATION=+